MPLRARGGASIALGALLGAFFCRLGGVGDNDDDDVIFVIVVPLRLLALSAPSSRQSMSSPPTSLTPPAEVPPSISSLSYLDWEKEKGGEGAAL